MIRWWRRRRAIKEGRLRRREMLERAERLRFVVKVDGVRVVDISAGEALLVGLMNGSSGHEFEINLTKVGVVH